VFGDADRGELRAVHAREGDEIASGIDHRNVQLPAALVGLRNRGMDGVFRLLQGDRRAVRRVERHFLGNDVERILPGRRRLLRMSGDCRHQTCHKDYRRSGASLHDRLPGLPRPPDC